MKKFIDLTGQRFGRWTVIRQAEDKDGKIYWHCKCDCGNEKDVYTSNLTRGKSKSCGCLVKERASQEKTKDLKGQRFGLLTVIKRIGRKSGYVTWLCKCDCGKEKIVDSHSLTSGNTKSCGCLSGMKDITGVRFGKLVAIKPIENKNGFYWLCQCDCGNTRNVYITKLQNGSVFSCGCEQRENNRNLQHGESGARIYKEYYGMMTRCSPNCKQRKNYYDRGITVCEEWINNFQAFYNWSMENGYRDDLTLDRIDNDGNYEPSNCRWATKKTQANNRRNNVFIEYMGEVKTMAQWCEFLGVDYGLVRNRHSRGIKPPQLFEPPNKIDVNKD